MELKKYLILGAIGLAGIVAGYGIGQVNREQVSYQNRGEIENLREENEFLRFCLEDGRDPIYEINIPFPYTEKVRENIENVRSIDPGLHIVVEDDLVIGFQRESWKCQNLQKILSN